MSDFMQRLIDAALNKVTREEGDTLPRTTEYGIKAGSGLQWRDMTPEERNRNVDKAKHQRARLAAKIADQVAERAVVRVAEHEAIDDLTDEEKADRKFHSVVDKFDVEDKARFTECLRIVGTMDRIVTKVAYDKFMWSRRLAHGAFGKDDVIQHTKLAVALEMYKSEKDLEELMTAAEVIAHRGLIQYGDEFPHTQWLMGVMTNRAKSSIKHLCQVHPTIDSIDRLDTMLANIGGVDSMISSCKADHAPGMTGHRLHSPGRHGLAMDPLVLAVALDREFTRRHLDPIVDLLLDDDRRRHDGTFEWAANAEEVLAACGEPVRKFESRTLAANYARRAVRRNFAWVNEFLTQVLAAYDGTPRKVWSNGREATHIDQFDAHTQREWVPIIQMPDPQAMAKVLVRALADLLTEALA